jgi:hypothetical protein
VDYSGAIESSRLRLAATERSNLLADGR